MIWSMVANVGAYVARVADARAERRGAPPGEPVRRRLQAAGARPAARASGAARRRRPTCSTCWRASSACGAAGEAFADYARARGAELARGERPQADADLVHFVEMQLAGVIGAASAHIMVASVVKEEALTLDEVRAMLDEASQIVVYSHRLEQKSQELERATAGAARGERAAHRARPHEGRVRLHGVARAAHAAHLDPLVHRDPARQPAAAGRRSASASSASSSRRPSG